MILLHIQNTIYLLLLLMLMMIFILNSPFFELLNHPYSQLTSILNIIKPNCPEIPSGKSEDIGKNSIKCNSARQELLLLATPKVGPSKNWRKINKYYIDAYPSR